MSDREEFITEIERRWPGWDKYIESIISILEGGKYNSVEIPNYCRIERDGNNISAETYWNKKRYKWRMKP